MVYDSFGRRLSETDFDSSGTPIASNNPLAVDTLFGFTGREWDADTELQYNRARWYDPAHGRWKSQDPLGFGAGDVNLYRVVGNHATGATDPSGLAPPSLIRYYYGKGARAFGHGAWVFFRETAYFVRDVVAVHAETLTIVAHEAVGTPTLRVEEWSAAGRTLNPKSVCSWSEYWSTATDRAGHAGAAAGTLGVEPMTLAVIDYAQTGDLEGAEERLGTAVTGNLTAAGTIKIAPAVGRAGGRVLRAGGRTAEEFFQQHPNWLPLRRAPRVTGAVGDAAQSAQRFLGEGYRTITNKAGDKIFMSKDGLRKMRFDFNNTQGDLPHVHLEVFRNGRWRDAIPGTHRIYPQP